MHTIKEMPRIVLVEDDVFLAEIYQTHIELAGLECHVANDGRAGLTLIQQQLPDLVMLDLMLPELSGDEVLRQMRSSDWGRGIRVVILTNISESEAPEDIKQLGIERYVVKVSLSKDDIAQIAQQVLGIAPPSPA